MSRRYFGHFGTNKINQGKKSININLDSDQAIELAIAIIRAARSQKRVDLAFYPATLYKRPGGKIPPGKIHSTVTSSA